MGSRCCFEEMGEKEAGGGVGKGELGRFVWRGGGGKKWVEVGKHAWLGGGRGGCWKVGVGGRGRR